MIYPNFYIALAEPCSGDRDKLISDWKKAGSNFIDLCFATVSVKLLQLFLSHDLRGALEPLAIIGNALFDLRVGGKPEIFFNVHNMTGGKKPSWDTGALTQGRLAAAADLLIRAGMTRNQAKDWLAQRIAFCGLLDEAGELVSANRIFQGRDHYNAGKGAVGARTVFEGLKQELLPLLAGTNKPAKMAWAKEVAEQIIRAMFLNANRSFPRANR
jgi:hypothetical protein